MDKYFNLDTLTIQTFNDSKSGSDINLAQIFPYSAKRIDFLSKQGAGIFFTINPQIDPWKRSIENTGCFKYLGLDLDIAKERQNISQEVLKERKIQLLEQLKKLEIIPNIVVNTKHGLQPIWVFTNPLELQTIEKRYEANEYYKSLIGGFTAKTQLRSEGDSLARVLRLENTYHQKNPSDKFLIKLIELNSPQVTIEEFAKVYSPNPLSENRTTVQVLSSGSFEGSRNMDLVSVIGSLFDHYHKDDWERVCYPLVQAVNAHFIHPPLVPNELDRAFRSIANTVIRKDPLQKYKIRSSSETSPTATPAIKTIPLEISFSKEFQQKLISRERHLFNELQELKHTDPEYVQAHKEWFRLRIKGEELGLFSSIIPIANEPWKTKGGEL